MVGFPTFFCFFVRCPKRPTYTSHLIRGLGPYVLLSFAQFEREVTSERIRDKIAVSKRTITSD